MRTRFALPGLIASLTLVATACSGTPSPSASPAKAADDKTPVAIATTTHWGSVLADITKCAGATSSTLMGPGDDPHEFSVSSSQVAALTKAKLVVANGLGLESGLKTTLANAKGDGAKIFEVGPQLDSIPFTQTEEGDDHDHGDGEKGHDHGDDEHKPGALDPHVFMDVGRVAKGAGLIGEQLAKATGDQKYVDCGKQVQQKLTGADKEMRDTFAAIPANKRVLVTDHDAFGYFSQTYGFKVAGVVVPGGGTDAEPNSAQLAALVKTIKEQGVHAIFSNNAVNPRLVDAVAKEVGGNVKVVELYVGSVGPSGSGADTYEGMMKTNTKRIADALK